MDERKKTGHVEDGGMSKERRARLIRETQEQIKQDPIYQFFLKRGIAEGIIDSHRKTPCYDSIAIRQYQEAAENGDSNAMNVLANLYRSGDGVTKDSDKSLFWRQRAAEAGNSSAMCLIAGRHNFRGSRHNSSEDAIKAIEWYTKAAEAGRSDAMNSLGWMYLTDKGISKDYEKATEWFRKAAEAGHIKAMDMLASSYERGIGVAQNYDKAVEWYRKAGQRGHSEAKKRLHKLGELL